VINARTRKRGAGSFCGYSGISETPQIRKTEGELPETKKERRKNCRRLKLVRRGRHGSKPQPGFADLAMLKRRTCPFKTWRGGAQKRKSEKPRSRRPDGSVCKKKKRLTTLSERNKRKNESGKGSSEALGLWKGRERGDRGSPSCA